MYLQVSHRTAPRTRQRSNKIKCMILVSGPGRLMKSIMFQWITSTPPRVVNGTIVQARIIPEAMEMDSKLN